MRGHKPKGEGKGRGRVTLKGQGREGEGEGNRGTYGYMGARSTWYKGYVGT